MGYYYPNGLSDKAGAHRLLTLPIYLSEAPKYVHSGAAAGGGGQYNRPYASLDDADSIGAFIIIKDGSAEVMTGSQTTSAGRVVVGEVSAGGVPTASMTVGYAGPVHTAVNYVQWANMRFPVPTVSPATARFTTGPGSRFVDCRLEEDSLIAGGADISASGEGDAFEGCTFVSMAATFATVSDQPSVDMIDDSIRILDCVFDDGAYGREAEGAVEGNSGGTGIRIYGASLLRSAAITAGSGEGSTFGGLVNIALATQGGGFWDVSDTWTLHPAGISDALGDALLEDDPLYASGETYYVDSVNGADTNAGTPEKPFATLVGGWAAITPAGHEVFVLRAGHDETIASVFDIDQAGVTVIGEGDPSDSTNCATLDITIELGLTVSGGGCEIRNVRVESAGGLASASPVTILTGVASAMVGCYFELGTDPNASGTALTANSTRLEDCHFNNGATATADRAYAAFGLGTSSLSGLLVKDVTIDGGTYGYSGWAMDFDLAGATSYLRGENIILLNGADAKIHEDSTGYCQITSSDTSKVEAF